MHFHCTLIDGVSRKKIHPVGAATDYVHHGGDSIQFARLTNIGGAALLSTAPPRKVFIIVTVKASAEWAAQLSQTLWNQEPRMARA